MRATHSDEIQGHQERCAQLWSLVRQPDELRRGRLYHEPPRAGSPCSSESELRVDLLAGTAAPEALLASPVRESVMSYVSWLPKLLESHGVTPVVIVAAGMTVRLGLLRASEDVGFRNHVQVPYECVVTLTDDRGREHIGRTRGWWSSHRDGPPPLGSNLFGPLGEKRPISRRTSSRPWWKFWARAA